VDRLSVLEPSVLDLRDDRGLEASRIRAFEQRWIDLIDTVADSAAVGIDYMPVISAEMDALIWGQDTAPAWVSDKALRMRLLSLFFQRLRPMFLTVDEALDACAVVDPRIDDREDTDAWLTASLRVLRWAALMPDDLVVDVGAEGPDSAMLLVRLEQENDREVPLCHGHEDFVRSLPIASLSETCPSSSLPRLVALAIKRFLLENPTRRLEYLIDFDDRFLELYDKAPKELRIGIIDAIVSRVTQTQKTAQADKGLKDEPLSGKSNRRMRVTRDWRIHYVYSDGPAITFTLVGVHDLGLRK